MDSTATSANPVATGGHIGLGLDIEVEFNRIADVFLPHRVRDGGYEAGGDITIRESGRNATDHIYARALEIIDAGGVAALTFGTLAIDLKMSTRTLRMRIGHRDSLIRRAVEQHVRGLTVDVKQDCLWEDAVQQWCNDLDKQLIARPHITAWMINSDSHLLASQVFNLAEYIVQQGIPLETARQCCASLARMAVSDAIVRCRGGLSAAAATAYSVESAPLDIVRWVVAGIRAEHADEGLGAQATAKCVI